MNAGAFLSYVSSQQNKRKGSERSFIVLLHLYIFVLFISCIPLVFEIDIVRDFSIHKKISMMKKDKEFARVIY